MASSKYLSYSLSYKNLFKILLRQITAEKAFVKIIFLRRHLNTFIQRIKSVSTGI